MHLQRGFILDLNAICIWIQQKSRRIKEILENCPGIAEKLGKLGRETSKIFPRRKGQTTSRSTESFFANVRNFQCHVQTLGRFQELLKEVQKNTKRGNLGTKPIELRNKVQLTFGDVWRALKNFGKNFYLKLQITSLHFLCKVQRFFFFLKLLCNILKALMEEEDSNVFIAGKIWDKWWLIPGMQITETFFFFNSPWISGSS